VAGLVTENSIVNPDTKLSDAGVHVVIDRVEKIESTRKQVIVGGGSSYPYDKLIMGTGSRPVVLDIPGNDLEGVFILRSLSHAEAIRKFLAERTPRKLTFVGAGFTSLETALLLKQTNPDYEIAIVELLQHPLAAMLDEDFSSQIETHLLSSGITLRMGHAVSKIGGSSSVSFLTLDSGELLESEMVFMNVGSTPNLDLARDMGLEMGPYGIKVNQFLETSDPDILAAGDCANLTNFVTGRPDPGALRGPAVLTGRLAAKHLAGHKIPFPGLLNASACSLFDRNVAATGLTEAQAQREAIETVSATVDSRSRHGMIPDMKPWTLKLIFDRVQRTLIGGQILSEAVSPIKEIDTISALILGKKTIEDLTVFATAGNPDISCEPSMEPISIAAEQCLQKLRKS